MKSSDTHSVQNNINLPIEFVHLLNRRHSKSQYTINIKWQEINEMIPAGIWMWNRFEFQRHLSLAVQSQRRLFSRGINHKQICLQFNSLAIQCLKNASHNFRFFYRSSYYWKRMRDNVNILDCSDRPHLDTLETTS